MKISTAILEQVAEIYDWLDSQILESANLAGKCDACGKCCNFDTPDPDRGLDHRLFVTPPELIYLAANLYPKGTKPMPTTRCPYNIDNKCSVYEYRFAGCRVFCCNADPDFQSQLSESTLKKLKSICTELEIPYRYTDLATALNHPSLGPAP